MMLSPHFTLAELIASNKAAQLGIDNTPPAEIMPRMVLLAEMLERIRSTLGVPVTVTSAYRGRRLNTAVGGVTSSDHARGQAADIVAPGFGTPYEIAKMLAPLVSQLAIGQLLLEHVAGRSWVHISTRVPDKIVNQVLTYDGKIYALGIQSIG